MTPITTTDLNPIIDKIKELSHKNQNPDLIVSLMDIRFKLMNLHRLIEIKEQKRAYQVDLDTRG